MVYWTYQRPVTIDGVEICVADTRVLDVDENLIRAWLLDWNLLVLDGATSLLNHLRPLLGRNGTHDDASKLFKMMYAFVWPRQLYVCCSRMLKHLSDAYVLT